MASLNKVLLIGNCGKDPEIRELDNGQKVASITLATSERFKDRNGEPREETEWHAVVAFGRLADIVDKYVRKGSMLHIEGKIKTRSWTDKEKNTHFKTEIVAISLLMLNRVDIRPQQADDDFPEDF